MNLHDAILWAEHKAEKIPSLIWFVKPYNDYYCVVDNNYVEKFPGQNYVYNTQTKKVVIYSNQGFFVKIENKKVVPVSRNSNMPELLLQLL